MRKNCTMCIRYRFNSHTSFEQISVFCYKVQNYTISIRNAFDNNKCSDGHDSKPNPYLWTFFKNLPESVRLQDFEIRNNTKNSDALIHFILECI